MAGRSQHHIPQSVLRAFARSPDEHPKRVWHYLRGAPIAHKATTEVAAQRDFYSKPDGTGETLDDVITDYEKGQFTNLLNGLRDLNPGEAVAHEAAAEYLGHLIPRGDHMRRVFGEAMGSFLTEAQTFAGDPERLAAQMGLDDLEPGGIALEEIRRLLEDPRIAPFLPVLGYPPSLLERLGFALMREFATPLLMKAAVEMKDQIAGMSFDVKGRVREAHTDALTKIGTGHRMPKLEGLSFSVEVTQSELLLPDCVAVSFNAAGEALPFGMMKRDEAVLVLAPLSPHRALVGRVRPDVSVPDDDALAAKLAACSHMFFVAATDNFRDLHAKLGEVTEAEVNRIVTGVFDRKATLIEEEEPLAPGDGNFRLTPPSGFSETEVAELGRFISDVAAEVHTTLPLRGLEGVTVSEAGDLQSSGAYLVDPGAMAATLEEGKLRLRAVLPRAAGEALVRESDENDFRLAFHLVLASLVRVGAATRLDALSAKYFREAGADWHPAIHQRGVMLALPVYMSMSALRPAGDDERFHRLLDDAASNAFVQADAHVEPAKAKFLEDGDADKFASIAADCALLITSASAAIAGRGHGDLTRYPQFKQQLETRGLTAWFNRFTRDLGKFWAEPRAIAEPKIWGIHSERLMLHWGIVSWPGERGTFTIGLPPMELIGPIQEALKMALAQLSATLARKKS